MKEKKFNLSDRFKKKEMIIDKETANELMNDTASKEANQIVNEIVCEELSIQETINSRFVRGIVSGCKKLNMRFTSRIESGIICVLSELDEVEVDTTFEHEDFYRIRTLLGIEGYCMKKYITIKE